MASLGPHSNEPPGENFANSSVTLVGSTESLGDIEGGKKEKRFHPLVDDVEVGKRLPGLPPSPPPTTNDDLPTIPLPAVIIEGHRFYIIMLCLCMGNFLAYFTETAVMTSLRVIGNEFHDSSNQSWIVGAFTLGFILPQLIIGRLCDIFGRSAVYNGTILLFAVGTLWCGLSESFASLLAARVIQGIGAAGRQTVGAVIIVDMTTRHNRGTWLGFFNFGLSLGLTAGLLIGAAITTNTTWRWSFYSCLIAIGFVFLLGVRYMSYPVPNREQSKGLKAQLRDVNWIGFIGAMVIASLICVPLLLGVNNCPWTNAGVLAPLLTGFALIPAWIHYEKVYPKNPVLEFSTFKLRNIRIATVVNFLVGSGYMGAIFFLPRYFTTIKKNTSLYGSGLQLSGLTLGEGFTSAFAGLLMCKTGRVRWVAFTGSMIFAVGSGLFLDLKSDSSVFLAIVFSTFIGVGSGFLFQPSSIAGPSSVQPHQTAAVVSWLNFIRGLGGITHAAVLTASFDAKLNSALGSIASNQVLRQGLGLADNWSKYPEYSTSIDNLLIQTFKIGAVIGIVSGVIMGITVLMLEGLDFKPDWWIRARLREREHLKIESEKVFVPIYFPN